MNYRLQIFAPQPKFRRLFSIATKSGAGFLSCMESGRGGIGEDAAPRACMVGKGIIS